MNQQKFGKVILGNKLNKTQKEIKDMLQKHRIIVCGDFNTFYLKYKHKSTIVYKPFNILERETRGIGLKSCCDGVNGKFSNYDIDPCDFILDSKFNKKKSITEYTQGYNFDKLYCSFSKK